MKPDRYSPPLQTDRSQLYDVAVVIMVVAIILILFLLFKDKIWSVEEIRQFSLKSPARSVALLHAPSRTVSPALARLIASTPAAAGRGSARGNS